MRAKLRALLPPAVLTALAFVVLVSLGNWQVRRLAWKEDLIARVHDRPETAAFDLRGEDLSELGDPAAFVEEHEYAPVLITGTYAPDGEVLVFTSLERPRGPAGGPGYWVLTPFVTPPSGDVVLVNRGFVPDGRQGDATPAPTGEQSIEGLIRAPETGSWLTPDPKPEERIFFTRDPDRIAGIEGLADAAHFFIDLDASYTPLSGLPQAGETRMSFPNNHLQYAITWYGLAAVLLTVFASFSWTRLREPPEERLTRRGRHP